MTQSTPEYWDTEYAENVIDDWRRMRWVKKRAQPFVPLLIGSVLDLGCGLGYLASHASGKYVGVDFSKVAVRYAGQTYGVPKAVRFVEADAFEHAAGLKDGSFKTVVLCHVLEHLEGDARSQLLADAKRIASKCVLVGLPMNTPDPSHVQPIWKRGDVQRLMGPVHIEQVGSCWVAVWDRDGRRFSLGDVPGASSKTPEKASIPSAKAEPKKSAKSDASASEPPVEAAKKV